MDRCAGPVLIVTADGDNGRMVGVTVQFTEVARELAAVARSAGLIVPSFRSPPRSSGVDRTITRRPSGVLVALRLNGRPFAAVVADMVEGVIAANRLGVPEAGRVRRLLWDSIANKTEAGDAGPSSPRRTLRLVANPPGAVA